MVGDIIYTKDHYEASFGAGDQKSAVSNMNLRWDNNELQYKFRSDITWNNRVKVKDAVKTFNDVFYGCVKIM